MLYGWVSVIYVTLQTIVTVYIPISNTLYTYTDTSSLACIHFVIAPA